MASQRISHNYEPSLRIAVHAINRRLRPEEKTSPAKPAIGNCSIKQSRISRLSKEKSPGGISIANGTNNVIAAAKRGKLDGLANIEAAVETAEPQLETQVFV